MQWVWFLLPTVLTLKNVKVHARQPNLHTSFLNYSRLERNTVPAGETSPTVCAFWGDIFKEVLGGFKGRVRLILIGGRLCGRVLGL